MPELAKDIAIRREGMTLVLSINGEDFPWHIAEDGVSLKPRRDECPAVTVTILAENVTVLDHLP